MGRRNQGGKEKMKKTMSFLLIAFIFILGACGSSEEVTEKNEENLKEEQSVESTEKEEPIKEVDTPKEEDVEEEVNFKTEGEANAEENPAIPGAMLFDKTEEKFKGMQYHFVGKLVKIEKVEGLFGNMENALLVRNDKGFVLPIFPPYEIEVIEGDEIEAWGPLSGDGYSSSDLGIDNVVGVTGAMNATQVDVNGEMQ